MCDNYNSIMAYKSSTHRLRQIQSTNTGDFYNEGPVYLFSNENISGYMPACGDLHGAYVLTVCASGDHAFESYLAGAAHVDTFDINSFQHNVMELKTHMIRDLKYEAFMDFFFNSRNFFDTRILRPIQHKFSPELMYFMHRYNKSGHNMFRYGSSHGDAFDIFRLSYLSDPKKYYELAEKLPERLSFKNCDISQISNEFPYKYDLIMLSNIIDYMYPGLTSTQERWQRFYKNNLYPLSYKSLVSNNGRICFEYMWGPNHPNAWANFISAFETSFVHSQLGKQHHTFSTFHVKPVLRGTKSDMVVFMHQNMQQNQKILQRMHENIRQK